MRTAAPHFAKLYRWPDSFIYKYEKFTNSVGQLIKNLFADVLQIPMCQVKIRNILNLKALTVPTINIINATVGVYT